ncbi:MAG: hypothetical protein RLP15_10385 [Cryomorphaceae bacterium]
MLATLPPDSIWRFSTLGSFGPAISRCLAIVAFFALLFVAPLTIRGQEHSGHKYALYESQDGIEVHGIWKHEKMFHKGQMMLCLKVINTNPSAATVAFEVNFYKGALLAETFVVEGQCIASKKKLKGRRDGLCLGSEEFSNDALMDDSFRWSIEELDVVHVEACEK